MKKVAIFFTFIFLKICVHSQCSLNVNYPYDSVINIIKNEKFESEKNLNKAPDAVRLTLKKLSGGKLSFSKPTQLTSNADVGTRNLLFIKKSDDFLIFGYKHNMRGTHYHYFIFYSKSPCTVWSLMSVTPYHLESFIEALQLKQVKLDILREM